MVIAAVLPPQQPVRQDLMIKRAAGVEAVIATAITANSSDPHAHGLMVLKPQSAARQTNAPAVQVRQKKRAAARVIATTIRPLQGMYRMIHEIAASANGI